MANFISNSSQLINFIDNENSQLKLYTTVQNNYQIGDNVYIYSSNPMLDSYTLVQNLCKFKLDPNNTDLAVSGLTGALSGLSEEFGYGLYNKYSQGYQITNIDYNTNSIVIDRLLPSLYGFTSFTGVNYVSKILIKNINIISAQINGILAENAVIDGTKGVVWGQGILLGGQVSNTTIGEKYTSLDLLLSANGDSTNRDFYYNYNNNGFGVSYFYNTNIIKSDIQNGYFSNCHVTGDFKVPNTIYGGYFSNSTICDSSHRYNIYGGEYKDTNIGTLVNWYNGIWDGGGIFGPYIWRNGTWNQGLFSNPDWYNGIFNGGNMVNTTFHEGTVNGGTLEHVTWLDGVFNSGNFTKKGVWYQGRFNSNLSLNLSIFDNSTWMGGTFSQGTFKNGSVWMDGEFLNGTFDSSVWVGGNFRGGTLTNCNNYDPSRILNDYITNRYPIWWDGNFFGGSFVDSVFVDGKIYGGNFIGQTDVNNGTYDYLTGGKMKVLGGEIYNGNFNKVRFVAKNSNTKINAEFGNFTDVFFGSGGNFYDGVVNSTNSATTIISNCQIFDGVFTDITMGDANTSTYFYNGKFNNGVFLYSYDSPGNIFYNGQWYNGLFQANEWYDGTFYDGIFDSQSQLQPTVRNSVFKPYKTGKYNSYKIDDQIVVNIGLGTNSVNSVF